MAGVLGKIKAFFTLDIGDFIKNKNKAEAGLNDLKNKAKEAGDSVEKGLGKPVGLKFDKLPESLSKLNSLRSALTATAATAAAFSIPIALIGKKAVSEFASFEQTMANVKAITGATNLEFKKLTETARNVGKTTVFSAEDAGRAMYYLASAGFTAEQQMQSLDGILKLSAATQSDIAFTSEVVASNLSAFGLAAKDTGRLVNSFAAAIAASQATLPKLAASLRYSAGYANSLQIPMEELVATLSVLYQNGQRGEAAGRLLASGLARLIKPTAEAQRAIKDLNLSISDLDPSKVGIREVVETLRKAGVDLLKLNQIFGVESSKIFATLINAAEGSIGEMQKTITGTNAVQEQYRVQTQTLRGELEKLKNVAKDVGITFGGDLAPAVKAVASVLKFFLNLINAIPKPLRIIITSFLTFTALAAPVILLSSAIKGLGVAMQFAGLASAGLLGPILAIGTAAVAVGIGVASLVDAVKNAEKNAVAAAQERVKNAEDEEKSVRELINRYKELANQAKRTKEEEKELLETIKKLKDIDPELSVIKDGQTGQVRLVNSELDKTIDKLQEQIKLEKELLDIEREKQRESNLAKLDKAEADLVKSEEKRKKIQEETQRAFDQTVEKIKSATYYSDELKSLFEDYLKSVASGGKGSKEFLDIYNKLALYQKTWINQAVNGYLAYEKSLDKAKQKTDDLKLLIQKLKIELGLLGEAAADSGKNAEEDYSDWASTLTRLSSQIVDIISVTNEQKKVSDLMGGSFDANREKVKQLEEVFKSLSDTLGANFFEKLNLDKLSEKLDKANIDKIFEQYRTTGLRAKDLFNPFASLPENVEISGKDVTEKTKEFYEKLFAIIKYYNYLIANENKKPLLSDLDKLFSNALESYKKIQKIVSDFPLGQFLLEDFGDQEDQLKAIEDLVESIVSLKSKELAKTLGISEEQVEMLKNNGKLKEAIKEYLINLLKTTGLWKDQASEVEKTIDALELASKVVDDFSKLGERLANIIQDSIEEGLDPAAAIEFTGEVIKAAGEITKDLGKAISEGAKSSATDLSGAILSVVGSLFSLIASVVEAALAPTAETIKRLGQSAAELEIVNIIRESTDLRPLFKEFGEGAADNFVSGFLSGDLDSITDNLKKHFQEVLLEQVILASGIKNTIQGVFQSIIEETTKGKVGDALGLEKSLEALRNKLIDLEPSVKAYEDTLKRITLLESEGAKTSKKSVTGLSLAERNRELKQLRATNQELYQSKELYKQVQERVAELSKELQDLGQESINFDDIFDPDSDAYKRLLSLPQEILDRFRPLLADLGLSLGETFDKEISDNLSKALNQSLVTAALDADYESFQKAFVSNIKQAIIQSVIEGTKYKAQLQGLIDSVSAAVKSDGGLSPEEIRSISDQYKNAFATLADQLAPLRQILNELGISDAEMDVNYSGTIITELTGQDRDFFTELFDNFARTTREALANTQLNAETIAITNAYITSMQATNIVIQLAQLSVENQTIQIGGVSDVTGLLEEIVARSI